MMITGKPTDEMLRQLLSTSDIDAYLKLNSEHFVDCTVADYLDFLLRHYGLQKPAVLRAAEMNEIYGYQIFAGKRVPSRDKLLSIGVGMGLTLEGIQMLMKVAGHAPLYAKSKRDSVIIMGVTNRRTVAQINDELYRLGEETL